MLGWRHKYGSKGIAIFIDFMFLGSPREMKVRLVRSVTI